LRKEFEPGGSKRHTLGQVTGEMQENALEKIVATLAEYKGKQRVDIRVRYQDDNQEWIPTKKGINLGLNSWKEKKDES